MNKQSKIIIILSIVLGIALLIISFLLGKLTNLDNKTHFSPLLTSQKIGNYLPDSIENKNNIYQTPSNISINRKEILLQTPNLIQTQTSH